MNVLHLRPCVEGLKSLLLLRVNSGQYAKYLSIALTRGEVPCIQHSAAEQRRLPCDPQISGQIEWETFNYPAYIPDSLP
jgi:hypothetical protein